MVVDGTGLGARFVMGGGSDVVVAVGWILEFILLSGVALAPDVLLQVHVVFERLSGGREGNRGQKLNHQTTKHTHGKREGEKGKEKEEREGRGKQSFRFFIPRERKTRND